MSDPQDEHSISSQDQEDKKTIKKKKFTCFSFLYIIFTIILIISLIEIFFYFYFVFCGMASLTINLFIYDWLSLFTKESIHIFLYILSNLTNFGLFFILLIFIVSTGKVYDSFKDMIFNFFKALIKDSFEDEDNQSSDCKTIMIDLLIFLMAFLGSCGLAILFYFVLFKWLFYLTVTYEIVMLIMVLSILYKVYSKIPIIAMDDEKAFSNQNSNLFGFTTQEIDSDNNNNNNNDEDDENVDDIEDILTIYDNNNENNNNFNDSTIDNNTDANIDESIFTIDVINGIHKKIEGVNYPEIVIKINSNIDSFNNKIQILNQVLKKLNENIDLTNNYIENLNKKDRITNIKEEFKYLKFYMNENSKMLKEIKDINDVMMNENNKISNYFINDVKYILFALKNLNYIINSPDNDDYIERISYFVKKINKFLKQKFNKRLRAINKFTLKINIEINEIYEKEINKNVDDEDENEDDDKLNGNPLFKILKQIPDCDGMFDKKIRPIKCLHGKVAYLVYKILICIFISGIQLYSILYPYLQGFISLRDFFLFLIAKIYFFERICSYNIIDICVNWKKTIKTLKKKKYRIIFYIVLALYGIILIVFIVFYIIVAKSNIFPTIDNAFFIENNQKWLKYKNLTIQQDGFCFTKAQNDGSLKTEDFAMLTTLPRLYGIKKDGKCYLKPSKRGLFNSTMKYIFGKNYENDEIRIMCKMMAHNLYLVITSEKILNQTLQNFDNYTILDKQFNIKNQNYFEDFNPETLPEKGQFYYNIYKNCLSQNQTNSCENEWDMFTQFYWTNLFSDEYINIPGFERYQINIDSDMVIQPSFIASDGQLWSGTHYIVGGGYEDPWNFGFFVETVGRKYIPTLLENILPMYSTIRKISKETLIKVDWFNKHIFYTDDFVEKELKSISDLYNQFNFSRQSLFSIGHSISGTVFKVISFSTDVQGIVFEASDGESNLNYLHKSHLTKSSESESLITNVYSDGTFFAGNDENCNANGVLPKRYILPSVYDTACLTAISCSDTMKYVPFCQQVLTQNKKDPLNEFNISFDAYLKHYGYV